MQLALGAGVIEGIAIDGGGAQGQVAIDISDQFVERLPCHAIEQIHVGVSKALIRPGSHLLNLLHCSGELKELTVLGVKCLCSKADPIDPDLTHGLQFLRGHALNLTLERELLQSASIKVVMNGFTQTSNLVRL